MDATNTNAMVIRYALLLMRPPHLEVRMMDGGPRRFMISQ
jgi:hypothetical protein